MLYLRKTQHAQAYICRYLHCVGIEKVAERHPGSVLVSCFHINMKGVRFPRLDTHLHVCGRMLLMVQQHRTWSDTLCGVVAMSECVSQQCKYLQVQKTSCQGKAAAFVLRQLQKAGSWSSSCQHDDLVANDSVLRSHSGDKGLCLIS